MDSAILLKPKAVYTVIKRFKEKHPEMIRRGTSYEPYDHMSIMVRIPGVGKIIYEYFGDKITWLEHWIDDEEVKRREKEERPNIYNKFCRSIELYMIDNHLTQQQFADIVGISRQSLIKYLNHHAIPKVNTMRRICKEINIDI